MEKLIEPVGKIAGIAGVLVCLIAGIARVLGNYHLMGFEIVSLFTGGIALMVMGVLAKVNSN